MTRHKKEYFESEEYETFMKIYRNSKIDGINSAQERTRNFNCRMCTDIGLGAWRHWGSYKNKDLILKYTHNPNLKGIDFGGAKGPISPYADIIDIADIAEYRLKIKADNLDIYSDNSIDYIWSSHTLEHVHNLVEILYKMYNILKPNGTILFLLPAYTCIRWRLYNHIFNNPHQYTFCLSEDYPDGISIDVLLKQIGFSLKKCYYCGDNSIFIYGEKI